MLNRCQSRRSLTPKTCERRWWPLWRILPTVRVPRGKRTRSCRGAVSLRSSTLNFRTAPRLYECPHRDLHLRSSTLFARMMLSPSRWGKNEPDLHIGFPQRSRYQRCRKTPPNRLCKRTLRDRQKTSQPRKVRRKDRPTPHRSRRSSLCRRSWR